MSFSEVQRAVEGWAPDEQDRLAGLLTLLRLKRNPGYQEELDRRCRDKNPANWLTFDELKSRLGEE